jgi:hypothetical protein
VDFVCPLSHSISLLHKAQREICRMHQGNNNKTNFV